MSHNVHFRKARNSFAFIMGEIFDIHDKRVQVAQLTIKRRKNLRNKIAQHLSEFWQHKKKDASRKNEFQFSPINGMCHENANSIKFMCNVADSVSLPYICNTWLLIKFTFIFTTEFNRFGIGCKCSWHIENHILLINKLTNMTKCRAYLNFAAFLLQPNSTSTRCFFFAVIW